MHDGTILIPAGTIMHLGVPHLAYGTVRGKKVTQY